MAVTVKYSEREAPEGTVDIVCDITYVVEEDTQKEDICVNC